MTNYRQNQQENWEYCLSVGNQAEQKVMNYWDNEGVQYFDRTSCPYSQEMDIDFTVIDDMGVSQIELKYQSGISKYGNIILELEVHRRGQKFDGWFNHTECDYLMFLDTENNWIMVDRLELKKLVDAHLIGHSKRWTDSSEGSFNVCWLVSVDDIKANIMLCAGYGNLDTPFDAVLNW